ncbi:hypothetical protein F310043J5_06760 [Anaerostipes hominis (ex Lee et al. 2021)]
MTFPEAKEKEDYTITYSNNTNTGSVTKTFYVVPKKQRLPMLSPKNPGS